MTEYLIGFAIGVAVTFVGCLIGCRISHTKTVVAQEKDYVTLQKHVDQCVKIIERIIYRSKE